MFSLKNFSINFSGEWLLLTLFILLAAGIGFYYYKYSLAELSFLKKLSLRLIRIAAIVSILLLAFEPAAEFELENIFRPKHYIFIDRSKSVYAENAEAEIKIIASLEDKLRSSNINFALNSFGDSIIPIETTDALDSKKSSVTNFENIFHYLKKEKANPSTITIISDGIINEGEKPIYQAEKLDAPIFAIGLGDTSSKLNLKIDDLFYNQIIYAGQSTQIRVTALFEGSGTANSFVDFFEENKLISTQPIELEGGIPVNLIFEFTPNLPGEHKISFRARELKKETNIEDNKKLAFIDVISNKNKITILSGMVSPDQRFIKAALDKDTNNFVSSLTFLGSGKILEEKNLNSTLDETEILFLINFPSKNISNDIAQNVARKIEERSLPFFFLLTNAIDAQKLKQFSKFLPVNFQENVFPIKEIQPDVRTSELRNPILKIDDLDVEQFWNSLPAAYQIGWDVTGKPESKILSNSKMNNAPLKTPLIVTRNFGKEKSILINASDIWRWKLLADKKYENFFDEFILNCGRWLRSDGELKRINVRTTKKIYAKGEEVKFVGEIYDESFNPIEDAYVKINIQIGKNEEAELSLSHIANGFYEAAFQPIKSGDFSFTANVSHENKFLGTVGGRFNIGEIDLELTNLKTDIDFLSQLSDKTGGKFFFNTSEGLSEILKSEKFNKEIFSTEKKEIVLWNYDWLLLVIILLFAIEWFIRKREGLL